MLIIAGILFFLSALLWFADHIVVDADVDFCGPALVLLIVAMFLVGLSVILNPNLYK